MCAKVSVLTTAGHCIMGTLIMSGNHSCRNSTYIYNVEKYYDTAKLMGRIYIQLFMIPSFSEQQNKKCCKNI